MVAKLACRAVYPGINAVLLGRRGAVGAMTVYDVTDPVHPHLACRLFGTSAHLESASGFDYLDPRPSGSTDVVIHRYVGDDLPGGIIADSTTDAVWAPSGGRLAYTMQFAPSPDFQTGATQVWLWESGTSQLLFTYSNGIGDCICRFGLPGPVLAFSFDGQYLAAGQLSGKGSEGIHVYSLSAGTIVATLPGDVANAFWDRGTERLFTSNNTSVAEWAPIGGLAPLPGAANWSFYPNLSPDGAHVVYTAYADKVNGTNPRVFLYTLDSGKSTMLVDAPRSQVVFVKKDWVWYLEETSCADCPNGTKPTGKVFAMNVTTGVEQQVVFASDEATTDLVPGEFWPNS